MSLFNSPKALIVLIGLASISLVLVGCSDRVRDTCETKPDAPRCDTSVGATTP